MEEETGVLLYTLLMVPDGKGFSSGSMKASSVYLNCKLFWSDAIAHSVISWGQANPSFHFVQVGTGIILKKFNLLPLFSVVPTLKLSFCLR